MEVKVNKEIRNYTESIYFGLSLRQFIFSILSCLMAVGLYFIMKPYFGLETLSWLCILGASPFAEQLIWAWIKSELLIPREIKFESNNVYWEAFIPYIANKEREELKRDKNVK